MFRKSSKSQQLNLYTGIHTLLTGKSLKEYEDKCKWHNQFREQITHRIDEEVFRPLFCKDFGAPNASLRVLTSMMILKEAYGWSDYQLFEQCRFNLLVRSALDLLNLDDSPPAESTYYLLRKRIVCHEKESNENLIEKVFAQVTKSQCIEFNVNGNKIRIDSKLLGSNIAWYSRYELIHETLGKVYRHFKIQIDRLLTASEISLLEGLSGESGEKVCYRSTASELESKMSGLGIIISKIISQMNDESSETLQILRRVFSEQYQVVDDVISTRSKHDISATSVQSPHDTECHYRKKDENQIKGYSVNATETCDEGKQLNLVTNVLVDTASAADCDFLQPAIEATREVVHQKIETVNADGAYHSVDNENYCQENSIDLIVSAIQGKPSRYDLTLDEEGQLLVTDQTTDTIVVAREVESRKKGGAPKWAIKTEQNKCRYFTKKQIDTCLLRKQISARPQAMLNVRNNVEATIFQLGYHYPNDKSRYRGLIKHKIWANVRCLWINFVRILNFVAGGGSKCVQKVKNRPFLPHFLLIFVKTRFAMSPVKNFYPCFTENRLWYGFLKSDFL
jgi:hypothetical protein